MFLFCLISCSCCIIELFSYVFLVYGIISVTSQMPGFWIDHTRLVVLTYFEKYWDIWNICQGNENKGYKSECWSCSLWPVHWLCQIHLNFKKRNSVFGFIFLHKQINQPNPQQNPKTKLQNSARLSWNYRLQWIDQWLMLENLRFNHDHVSSFKTVGQTYFW